jgi:hypothetical protein
MKQSVLVLLSFYANQGIGWVFGSLIVIPNSTLNNHAKTMVI